MVRKRNARTPARRTGASGLLTVTQEPSRNTGGAAIGAADATHESVVCRSAGRLAKVSCAGGRSRLPSCLHAAACCGSVTLSRLPEAAGVARTRRTQLAGRQTRPLLLVGRGEHDQQMVPAQGGLLPMRFPKVPEVALCRASWVTAAATPATMLPCLGATSRDQQMVPAHKGLLPSRHPKVAVVPGWQQAATGCPQAGWPRRVTTGCPRKPVKLGRCGMWLAFFWERNPVKTLPMWNVIGVFFGEPDFTHKPLAKTTSPPCAGAARLRRARRRQGRFARRRRRRTSRGNGCTHTEGTLFEIRPCTLLGTPGAALRRSPEAVRACPHTAGTSCHMAVDATTCLSACWPQGIAAGVQKSRLKLNR